MGRLVDDVDRVSTGLGLACVTEPGEGEGPGRRAGRLHVTMLGRPLLPAAVQAVTGELAARGANVDRIRRLAAPSR